MAASELLVPHLEVWLLLNKGTIGGWYFLWNECEKVHGLSEARSLLEEIRYLSRNFRQPLKWTQNKGLIREINVLLNSTLRSNYLDVKKGVLKNFAKLTGEHWCQAIFFNEAVIRKRLWKRCLWILRNFQEQLSSENSSDGCFWTEIKIIVVSKNRRSLNLQEWKKNDRL